MFVISRLFRARTDRRMSLMATGDAPSRTSPRPPDHPRGPIARSRALLVVDERASERWRAVSLIFVNKRATRSRRGVGDGVTREPNGRMPAPPSVANDVAGGRLTTHDENLCPSQQSRPRFGDMQWLNYSARGGGSL